MRMLQARPNLPVRDIARSVQFYRDKIGIPPRHQEEGFAMISRDAIEVHLWLANDVTWRSRKGDEPIVSDAESFLAGTAGCRIRVEGVEELYNTIRPLGIVHGNAPLTDQPWGDRDFAILDPDGNLVTFFQPIKESASIRRVPRLAAQQRGRVGPSSFGKCMIDLPAEVASREGKPACDSGGLSSRRLPEASGDGGASAAWPQRHRRMIPTKEFPSVKPLLSTLRTVSAQGAAVVACMIVFGWSLAVARLAPWAEEMQSTLVSTILGSAIGITSGGCVAALASRNGRLTSAGAFGFFFGTFAFVYLLGPTPLVVIPVGIRDLAGCPRGRTRRTGRTSSGGSRLTDLGLTPR